MNRTSLQLLLTKLKDNNYLPKTFTINKLDNSLRTLAKVLADLKKAQKPSKHHLYLSTTPPSSSSSILATEYPMKIETTKQVYNEDVETILPPKYVEGILFSLY